MGRVLSRAIEAAGLGEYQARALNGAGLSSHDIERLRGEDLLLVAGLADAVRAQFHGDDVPVLNQAETLAAGCSVFAEVSTQDGLTGAELLRDLALLRLATPGHIGIAVSFDALGLELAQTALLFGADVLLGELGGQRTLPLLDGPVARRREIEGLIARSGRRARFSEPTPKLMAAEQHP
jgi:hypothetical protein